MRVGLVISPVVSGVPQGTILGALYFLLYVKDLPGQVRLSELVLYADNSKLYTNVNSIEDCLKMNVDVCKI